MGEQQIIDGKEIAKSLRAKVKDDALKFEKSHGCRPGLSVILVGKNEASHVYVNMKEKACKEAGIVSNKYLLDEGVDEKEVLELVEKLNRDDGVHGILIQLPLPNHLNTNKILERVDHRKDVDGFHPINIGRLYAGEKSLVPCTPAGIIKLIESTGRQIEGANALVIGRSNIVGKPVSALLLKRNATVTVCHSRTRDLRGEALRADILVAAIGKPEFVKGSWIKEGSVVIDVGVNRMPDGKLKGDVEFEEAKKRADHITPVPGGVGPMTIAMLLSNTMEAAWALKGERYEA